MFLMRGCILLSLVNTVALWKYCNIKNVIIDIHEEEHLTMIGVKMCSLKCEARGYCWSIGYDVVNLTCHVLKLRLDYKEECGHIIFKPKQRRNIQAGPCSSETCRDRRCLETRSGKELCVKGMGEMTCEEDTSLHITSTIHPPDPNGRINNQRYQIRLNKRLFGACMDGDINRVKCILFDDRADINIRCLQRKTPVMIAVEKAYRQAFNILVRNGADLYLRDDGKDTILHLACERGNLDIIKFLLIQDTIDINFRGGLGRTPVMTAALKGHKDVFDLLVRKGADLSPVDVTSNTILHLACEGGKIDIVKHILSQNTVNINSFGKDNLTPAMKAAIKGHKDVFNLLVRKGADLSGMDVNSNTILHLACEGGKIDIVKHILSQNNVNINSLGENGRTPAMKAVLKGHKDIFDMIVKHGADLSLIDEEGDSILHAACEVGNVEIVNYILTQSSVDINLRGKRRFTPVLMAAYAGHEDVFNVLVKENADMLIKDIVHSNILHLACKGGNMEIIKYILTNYSIDVNDINLNGATPILLAASEGRKDMFDLLLQNGADLTHEDKRRSNILHMACQGGNVEVVKYILAQNIVKINSRTDDGWSPAMEAADAGHVEVLKVLVSEGADLTIVNSVGNTLLYLAVEDKHVDIVKYVITNDILDIDRRDDEGMTAVMLAAEDGLAEIFDLLVRRGANLSLVSDEKQNILHMACAWGHSEIVKYILTENVVNINDREDEGKTPVLLAAEKGYIDIVGLLESKGADLSVVDDDGENILHKLSMDGQEDLVNHLLTQKGVVQNINKKGLRGRTPVMIAARHGNKEIFDALVKKGADLTQVDDDGNSILHLACEGPNIRHLAGKGTVDIVKYLLSKNIVDINSRGPLNRTPVLIAAFYGNRGALQLLMKQGADVHLKDDEGNSILSLSRQ